MTKETRVRYDEALAELEKIVTTVEDPKTPIGDIEAYLHRADELVKMCTGWLRGVREKTLDMES